MCAGILGPSRCGAWSGSRHTISSGCCRDTASALTCPSKRCGGSCGWPLLEGELRACAEFLRSGGHVFDQPPRLRGANAELTAPKIKHGHLLRERLIVVLLGDDPEAVGRV